jgi:hypothetical protein
MRKPLIIALAATVVALAACGGTDATGPGNVSGTYNLQTINDSTLQHTTSESSTHKVEVLSSVITLNEDRTYAWVQTTRTTDSGEATTQTTTDTGTYSVRGSKITLKDSNGSSSGDVSFFGFVDIAISGDTITMDIVYLPVILVLVFKR